MTREDIIRIAIEAKLNMYVNDLTEKQYIEVVEHFAALVASAEREACAKIADSQLRNTNALLTAPIQSSAAYQIGVAIRARGQA